VQASIDIRAISGEPLAGRGATGSLRALRLRCGSQTFEEQVLQALAAHPGYALLPLDIEQALEFATLASVRDPVDGIILAAAGVTEARLVSADRALGGHGVSRLCD
jgi:PIN domain nuclease of toxin-antitoxin system